MMSVTNLAYHTWLQLYEESFPTDYSNLYACNTNQVALEGMALGESDDPDKVIEKLLEFPFFGTFMPFVKEGEFKLSVCILHHFFKNSPQGVRFRAGKEEAFAWKGFGPDAMVIELNPSAFQIIDDMKGRTPTLRDFIQVAGVPEKVDRLDEADESSFTNENIKNQELDNGDPLPFAQLRRCGGVIPPFLIPCFKSENPRDILHECLAKIRYRVEDDLGGPGEDDGLNFWKACFPFLQRLWMMW